MPPKTLDQHLAYFQYAPDLRAYRLCDRELEKRLFLNKKTSFWGYNRKDSQWIQQHFRRLTEKRVCYIVRSASVWCCPLHINLRTYLVVVRIRHVLYIHAAQIPALGSWRWAAHHDDVTNIAEQKWSRAQNLVRIGFRQSRMDFPVGEKCITLVFSSCVKSVYVGGECSCTWP